jgi:hypothetical protein
LRFASRRASFLVGRCVATRHLAPHPRQLEGDAGLGVPPLRWQEGDDSGNIRALAEVSAQSLAYHVPEVRDAHYDFDTGTFRDGEGKPIPDEAFSEGRDTFGGAGEARAGSRTLKRGALLISLLRRESEEGPGLLAQVLHQLGELVAGTPLERTFYQVTAYHGSPMEFTVFAPGRRGSIDFTTDRRLAERYRQPRGLPSRGAGHLYEVKINADEGDFLNLDRPLNQQGEAAQAALRKAGIAIDD